MRMAMVLSTSTIQHVSLRHSTSMIWSKRWRQALTFRHKLSYLAATNTIERPMTTHKHGA